MQYKDSQYMLIGSDRIGITNNDIRFIRNRSDAIRCIILAKAKSPRRKHCRPERLKQIVFIKQK
jgi:hypothetical protein